MTYLDEILRQALELAPEDRAFVAAALEKSLSAAETPLATEAVEGAGPDTISGGEFLAKLQRRSAAYKNGEMMARPAAEVIAELRRTPTGGQGN